MPSGKGAPVEADDFVTLAIAAIGATHGLPLLMLCPRVHVHGSCGETDRASIPSFLTIVSIVCAPAVPRYVAVQPIRS